MKKYDSFEEINEDLKVLKLQKEIDKEKLKLNFNIAKSQVDLSPMKMAKEAMGSAVSNAAGTIAKKAVLMKMVSKFFRFGK